jgi:hypothetical protein
MLDLHSHGVAAFSSSQRCRRRRRSATDSTPSASCCLFSRTLTPNLCRQRLSSAVAVNQYRTLCEVLILSLGISTTRRSLTNWDSRDGGPSSKRSVAIATSQLNHLIRTTQPCLTRTVQGSESGHGRRVVILSNSDSQVLGQTKSPGDANS